MTESYQLVLESNEDTVLSEYKRTERRAESYQSESELEQEFVDLLRGQGYEYCPFHEESDLIENLRLRLEELNDVYFTKSEWERYFRTTLANATEGIVEKTRRFQEDYYQAFERDDGTIVNIYLVDKRNVHHNKLQVMKQYEVGKESGAVHANRYDVTILLNGLPVVHIELKRRGVSIREAFNQIGRYQRDSFWSGHGLFQYVQLFVISNGTETKYYSNSTRVNAIKESQRRAGGSKLKTSASFEFTSYWADAANEIIPDLVDFTKTFFAKHTLLNILTRYCVFTTENLLLVMRPYQIAATERILSRIEISHNRKTTSSTAGGGYVWHTTGSGKTLTSFKTARLAADLPYIDKVLFVVDRKDLDYQTIKEYDRFEKGAANSNSSTRILKKQLESPRTKIVITTIQKLSKFIKGAQKDSPVFTNHMVFIFDECHRSQFGSMHSSITKAFKKYHIFGFTGTPIFAANAPKDKSLFIKTTEQAFGGKLHTYTLLDAIQDGNVLPFRVDYISTMKIKDNVADELIPSVDRLKALNNEERIAKIVEYILNRFDQKTYRGHKSYWMRQLQNVQAVASSPRGKTAELSEVRRVDGFNSILAVGSIEAARLYYAEFQKQMKADESKRLRIATIFSYVVNEEEKPISVAVKKRRGDTNGENEYADAGSYDGNLEEENSEDVSGVTGLDREFLENAIADYNAAFKTNYSTDGDSFQNYYKDVSLRMKNKEIDLLIVVNMFLTGFDATTLNTLWVDKNLKTHGLIQAFSRTNRILNSIKTFGNIVCFRNLQTQVDEAIALFGNKDAGGIVIVRKFEDYFYGYKDAQGRRVDGYVDLVARLLEQFPLSEPRIIGEKSQKEFILLFGAYLRMRNLLTAFDQFEELDTMTERDLQDYLGRYQDLRDELTGTRGGGGDPVDIGDDLVFEIELVKQIDVNIDYILALIERDREQNKSKEETLTTVVRAVDSSTELRSKKELIEEFIARVNYSGADVREQWREYVDRRMEADFERLVGEERLKPEETRKFLANAFRDGEVKTVGDDINKIMPPTRRFGGGGGGGGYAAKKMGVVTKLRAFFDRFFGVGKFESGEPNA